MIDLLFSPQKNLVLYSILKFEFGQNFSDLSITLHLDFVFLENKIICPPSFKIRKKIDSQNKTDFGLIKYFEHIKWHCLFKMIKQ